MITFELQIAYVDTLNRPNSRLAYYNIVFTSYFTLELILKLMGYGVRGYFRVIATFGTMGFCLDYGNFHIKGSS